ncbi:DUF5455 family protein [Variovorax saccharolyticus]|uniref:DUF5455 family protein n=1 Tax=Variovorax saccharolyticus TaxID=3053516 RepID=UPI002576CE47|nr:DUF5455 family protein [Variovorax sp. J31P216]MDM0027768.1 DUF5455 family protein [Variovorax sp. J31P216]
MPLLAGLIASLFGGVASFLAQIWAKKIVVAGLAIAAFAAALAALLAVFNALVSPLVAAMFSTQYGQFIGLAFPPIAGTCMTSIATCWGACALYKLKMQSIKMSASA